MDNVMQVVVAGSSKYRGFPNGRLTVSSLGLVSGDVVVGVESGVLLVADLGALGAGCGGGRLNASLEVSGHVGEIVGLK